MSGLRVIAGLDVEAKQARKEARRRAVPLQRKWTAAILAHVKSNAEPRLLIGDCAFAAEMLNFPSANYGYCYAGQTRLGDTFGASRSTAQRAMCRLKAAGFLICRRGGQGRTSRWIFAVAGEPLFSNEKTAQPVGSVTLLEASPVTPQDASPVTPQEASQVKHKPYEQQPIEHSLSELQPKEPSPPPPSMTPREARPFGREMAKELLSGLTYRQRQHARWRGLSIWISDQLERGAERVDIACGIAMALPSLKSEPPSTYDYFRQPIERARASRLRPLPDARGNPPSPPASAPSLQGFASYIENNLSERRGALAARLDPARLEDLHRGFCAKTIGMPEALATVRGWLAEGGGA